MMCWYSVYSGLPFCLCAGNGSQFCYTFGELSALQQIEVDKSSTYIASELLNVSKKPLRDSWRKSKKDYPKLYGQVLLLLSVKAINDTLGPKVLSHRPWYSANSHVCALLKVQ